MRNIPLAIVLKKYLNAGEILFSDLITLCTTLAPAQQRVSPGAAMTPQQSTETVLRSVETSKRFSHKSVDSYTQHTHTVLRITYIYLWSYGARENMEVMFFNLVHTRY